MFLPGARPSAALLPSGSHVFCLWMLVLVTSAPKYATLCPYLSLIGSLPLIDCLCSSDKESDSLLRDNVKQAVLHGLRDALGKSKNDDIAGLKLLVIREGVAAALKESFSQYNICFDCDDTDPHIRLMIQEAVEEGLKAYGYQIPKKDTKSGEGAEFSAHGAASWDPAFGLTSSSQPN
ncbi:hypothetical protein CFC21_087102, partial [Triticum aestivum]